MKLNLLKLVFQGYQELEVTDKTIGPQAYTSYNITKVKLHTKSAVTGQICTNSPKYALKHQNVH